MDKESSAVRKYLAQRADLIGAIRLPNTAFKKNAGTEVTSDIIFLQKRDRIIDIEPDWVHLDTDENGIKMNSYFVQHPEMVLGDMVMESSRFGMESTCRPYEDADLGDLLNNAISNLHAELTDYEVDELSDEEDLSIPADPNVRNFSYTVVDGKLYFRENSRMHPANLPLTTENRVRGMILLRDCVRQLIEYQTENYPDEIIKREQERASAYLQYVPVESRKRTPAAGCDTNARYAHRLFIMGHHFQAAVLRCKHQKRRKDQGPCPVYLYKPFSFFQNIPQYMLRPWHFFPVEDDRRQARLYLNQSIFFQRVKNPVDRIPAYMILITKHPGRRKAVSRKDLAV